MDINDLYFCAKRWDFNKNKIVDYNIFNSLRVMRSVALYVKATKTKKPSARDLYIRSTVDPIMFCFLDLRGRFEYEMDIDENGNLYKPFSNNDNTRKTDIFTLYVEPNASKLMDIVNQVSLTSARKWLREERKRYGR